ncbi:MOSC domain-containing protein [Streptomyces sp. NPDC006393]|uniref:MOSC domain-containing protein n=1 Tax=Streptomyces sp. NPDC006393 TaxID=3156763 RepID=UPI00340C687E
MRVDQIWRYPVKSVGGEPLTAAAVGALGIEGDRGVAVHDERDEVTWAGAVPALMRLRAVAVGPGLAELILPDGRRFRSDAPDAADRLSAAVQAEVTLAGHRPPHPPHTALHVMTTTALRSLAAALPDSALDASRFRPNLVLDDAPGEVDGDHASGYPEHDWIGRRMAVGSLRLRFTEGCDRCVMITKETPTVPHDRSVLRWVARELGNTLGVYAAVETPGRVRVGDTARWL